MSKDDRLVTPPANARGIYIPQEYIAICTENKTRVIPRGKRKGERIDATEYNLAAAAILRLIERWAHWKIRQAHGKLDLDAAWIWMPQKQLEDFELVNAFGGGQIKTGIALLLDKGFISRRNNPELGFDRTYQYRFEKKAVQDALDKLAPFLTIDDWKHEHSSMEQSEPIDASTNSDEAIPQVPSQVTAQGEKTLSGAKAAPEPRFAVGQRVVLHTGETGRVAEVRQRGEPATPEYQIVLDEGGPRWCAAGDVAWPASDPEPPAPPADPPTPPTPKRGPTEHQQWVQTIAEECFNIPPGAAIPDGKQGVGARSGAIRKEIAAFYPDLTRDGFRAACAAWRKKRDGHGKPLIVPNKPDSVITMLGEVVPKLAVVQPAPEPELDAPHAYLKRIREERDRARQDAFLSAS